MRESVRQANHRTGRPKLLVVTLLTMVELCSAYAQASQKSLAAEALQLKTYLTHSRLLFKVDESILVDWKKNFQGFELLFKGVTLNDLGAPMGEEQRWKSLYKGLSDARVGSIDIQETDKGVLIRGKWKYPQGQLALAKPEMEVFDYREKTPPRFVIDFWVKKGPTRYEAENDLKHRQHLAALKKTQEEAQARIEKRQALEKKRADIANASRFCDRPLTDENDIFIEFQPIHTPYQFSRWLPNTTPDQHFNYFRPKRAEKDAQYVRLALNLYSKGNLGLANRTLDFLDKEFPQSEFKNQMAFLKANLMIKLAHPEAADLILRKLIREEKNSPVALHSAMYLASKQMESKSYQMGLQTFFWLIQNYPSHDSAWVFHLGAAECLYSMHETDRAAKEYRWVIENAPTEEFKAEAAFRMGDIYQLRFQYEQSLAAYFQGINYFSAQAHRFPGFHLNRAESLYQLRQYDRAEAAFKDFLEKFPSFPSGWRATLRLGEIYGRRENNSLVPSETRKWNYETINRYPFSPGETLARLRLLPCGDHGGFDLATAERFFDQVREFDAPTEILMKNFQDFRAVSHVRTLITMGSHDETALAAIHELQNIKGQFARVSLSSVANDFFQKMIMRLLNEGKKYEALSYYSSVGPIMPPAEVVTDIDYLLKLSQAASDLGLGGFAKKLSDTYETQLKRNRQIAGSFAGASGSSKTGGLVMDLDEFQSQQRVSERSFTEAKALWVAHRNNPKKSTENDPELFDLIRRLLSDVRDESPYSSEKEVILALIDQQEGQPEKALRRVTHANTLGASSEPMRDSILAWLAELQKSVGDPDIGLQLYEELEKRLVMQTQEKVAEASSPRTHASSHSDNSENSGRSLKSVDSSALSTHHSLGIPAIPPLTEVLRAQAEILEKKESWPEVVEVYQRANEYGIQDPSIQYYYARALEKTGSLPGRTLARDQFEKLSKLTPPPIKQVAGSPASAVPSVPPPAPALSSDEAFWKRMASETLADSRSMGTLLDAKEGTK